MPTRLQVAVRTVKVAYEALFSHTATQGESRLTTGRSSLWRVWHPWGNHQSSTKRYKQAHKAVKQAGDEPGALQALEPARAAVRAQQHKAASFSAHQQAAAQQAPFLLRFSASWIHTAMLTTEVSLMEKKKQYLAAVELLQLLLGACRPYDGASCVWHGLLSPGLSPTGKGPG